MDSDIIEIIKNLTDMLQTALSDLGSSNHTINGQKEKINYLEKRRSELELKVKELNKEPK